MGQSGHSPSGPPSSLSLSMGLGSPASIKFLHGLVGIGQSVGKNTHRITKSVVTRHVFWGQHDKKNALQSGSVPQTPPESLHSALQPLAGLRGRGKGRRGRGDRGNGRRERGKEG